MPNINQYRWFSSLIVLALMLGLTVRSTQASAQVSLTINTEAEAPGADGPLLLEVPALRISVETLAAVSTEAALVLGGIWTAAAADNCDRSVYEAGVYEPCERSVGEEAAAPLFGWAIGSALAGFVLPASVWGIGEASGRRGSDWMALAGHAIGWASGFGISIAIAASQGTGASDATGALIVTSMLLLPAIGTVVAYELSAHDEAPAPAPSVMPTAALSPTGDGGMVGVAGTKVSSARQSSLRSIPMDVFRFWRTIHSYCSSRGQLLSTFATRRDATTYIRPSSQSEPSSISGCCCGNHHIFFHAAPVT